MRTVVGNIKNLTTSYQNRKLTFNFCDKYGNESIKIIDGITVKTKNVTTDNNGDFTIDLFETLKYQKKYHYVLTTTEDEDNINPIKLHIPVGDTNINLSNILMPAKTLSTFYEYVETNGVYKFGCNIKNIFEKYFAGENEFFTQEETNLINIFIEYANGNNEREDMSELNKYLGSL